MPDGIVILKKIRSPFLIGIALMLLIGIYVLFSNKPDSKKEFTSAPPIPVAASIPTESVPVKDGTVKVLNKKTTVKKVKYIPKEITDNPNKEISATATVEHKKNSGGVDIISTVDTQTGETQIYTQDKPRPFFVLGGDKEIGIGYGISTQKGSMVEVHGSYDAMRIGSVHVTLYGEYNQSTQAGNTQPEGRALIRANYRW